MAAGENRAVEHVALEDDEAVGAMLQASRDTDNGAGASTPAPKRRKTVHKQ
jgi:hypothetical protein